MPIDTTQFNVSIGSACEEVAQSIADLQPGEVVLVDAPLQPGDPGCAAPTP